MMKNNIEQGFTTKLLRSFLVAVIMTPVYADDTEIFYTESEVNNNILFVMDNSGSMATEVAGAKFNNGKDYVETSTIKDVKDDTEEAIVTKAGDYWPYYRKLKADNPSLSYRAALKIVKAWYRSVKIANPKSNDLELGQEYDSEAGKDIKKRVGLRFTGIQVPKEAKITSAYIQFTASNNDKSVSSDASNLKVYIRKSSNSRVFKARKNAIKSGSWKGPVNWSPLAWNAPNESGDNQKTADLTDLIQYIVNRSGWKKGHAMSFKIKGTGKRIAQSFDFDGEAGAPILTITYAPEKGLKTRIQVMQDALKVVLKDAPDNLSVGIMHYGDSYGFRKNYPSGVSFPVTQLNALARPIIEESIKLYKKPAWRFNTLPVPNETVTVRQYLSEIANSWKARGNTPIVESIYEASLYFRGKRSNYGDFQADYWYAAHPSTYVRPAPDLVELLQKTHATSYCTGKPYNYKVWNENIGKWRSGNAWGNCPKNPLIPTGPGSKANCTLAGNENNCGTGKPYRDCVDWVNAVWEKVCTGTDESGNETGCSWKLKSNGYCKNNIYGEKQRDKWCYYKVCKDEYARQHVGKYNSPAISDCQSNNIILMSDGKPETRNNGGEELFPQDIDKIKSFMGNPSCENAPFGFKSGQCGSELTHHLADNDINSNIKGKQTIETYVVGFSSGITASAEGYLKSLVTVDDNPDTPNKEGYFSAQNEEELAAAFKQTLNEIAAEARSQASPGYSVNVKSGLEHENNIYIPVFDKSTGARWSGNLKKFKLVEVGDKRLIRGKAKKASNSDGTGYINAMTELGLFKDSAWDDWSKSDIPDGNNVEKGGVASLLANPKSRKLYTNIVASEPLYNVKNSLKANNIHIKNSMLFDRSNLGLSVANANKYRKRLLNFIRGWTDGEDSGFPDKDISSHARKHMGDMLHSEPVVITYEQGDDNGKGKKQYIFAATNEGYLHVFDSTTGKEKFAFMPKELLKNIQGQYTQKGDHVYGIDGNLSFFIVNNNHNGQVDTSEKVWIYFGLRRGGSSYYALDVTNINKPKLKWIVNGGDSGFEHLNQSWSAPYIANSKVGGNKKPVIIFTGGNDPVAMDYGSGKNYNPADVKGSNTTSTANGVYIVDADTGKKLWDIMDIDGAPSKLKHGIPGGVRILDINRNDYLDRLYFADAGGYVWRLDLDEGLKNSKSILTKFASLGGSGTAARKFYNEPDVAVLRSGGKAIFSVSVGSGIRAHPMNTVIDDHMFILLDETPFLPMEKDFNDPIEMSDLEEVTIKDNGSSKIVGKSLGFEGKKITELSGKKGWYASFGEPGEKILASSITFEGSIIFTTLVPKVLNKGDLISACAAPSTQGRLYAMDLLTGEASMDLNNSGKVPNDDDIFTTVSASEIPGTPQRVFNKLECSGGACTHNVDIRIGKKSSQAGTTDVETIEPMYWAIPEASHK